MRFVSSKIPVSSAGTVPLGGAADVGASKLETGDPNMARTAMDGSICGRGSAYWGCAGAGHWYCGNLNLSILLDMFYNDPDLIKVHIVHDLKASQIDRYDFKDTKCLTENLDTSSCIFVGKEVTFHTSY